MISPGCNLGSGIHCVLKINKNCTLKIILTLFLKSPLIKI